MNKEIKKEFETLAQMIKRGFDDVDQRFNKVESRLDNLKLGHEEIKLKLDQVAYKFELDELTKRVQKTEFKLGLHKS